MRIRDLLAVTLSLVLLAGLGYGVWLWFGDTMGDATEDQPEPVSEPDAIATRYLDAWAAGEHVRMADLVRDPPEDFVARHFQLWDTLEPTAATITAGDRLDDVDGRARYPVTVEFEVPFSAEPIGWETELELIRERGDWGVEWSPTTIHPELRESWEFGTETESVGRQDILAQDGTVLSGGATLVTFGFEPTAVQDVNDVVEAFAEALPGSEDAARRELNRSDLVDGWFYPIVTVSEARADDTGSILRQVPGILRQTDSGRALYAEGFAQHVVGIVAEATAEQLEERGEEVAPGVLIGQYGLEGNLEDRLLGSDLVRVGLRERDQIGDAPLRVVIAESQADASGPVTTTLDVQVQQAIENALTGLDGSVGIVAVDAQDGAIRGVASRPLSGYNRAFEGRYPPGSTFKTVTAEALLRSGIAPDDVAECPAETSVGGLRIRNAGNTGRGTVTLSDAFAYSCNTTFATLGADLGADELIAAAERFGFGVEPDLPLEAFGGAFPEPVDTADRGAASFGQGRVQASVLHMASVAAAATTGTWHPPYLLTDDGPGDPIALSDGVSEPLRQMMRAAVTDGTGTAADVSGSEVLGKTGTAQATDGVEHAWFIGAYDGVAFSILVEEGGSGGQVAAPIAARVVTELAALRAGSTEDEPAQDGNGQQDDGPDANGQEDDGDQ